MSPKRPIEMTEARDAKSRASLLMVVVPDLSDQILNFPTSLPSTSAWVESCAAALAA